MVTHSTFKVHIKSEKCVNYEHHDNDNNDGGQSWLRVCIGPLSLLSNSKLHKCNSLSLCPRVSDWDDLNSNVPSHW